MIYRGKVVFKILWLRQQIQIIKNKNQTWYHKTGLKSQLIRGKEEGS